MSCVRRAPRKEREKMKERMIEMSKWTDARDSIVDTLQTEEVTEELKQNVTKTILDEIVPVVENVVDTFCAVVKEQSKGESGWCKIRDMLVLPLLMQGMVGVIKFVLGKTVAKTGVVTA